MAITHRKGDYNDYDPSRMRPAEFGITLTNDPKAVDGRAVHIAFAAGEDKTLMTFEDAETMIEIAAEEATAAATSQAQQYANNSASSATQSRSYAKGGTSSRSGEDTDNAMYYKNQAANSATAASNSAAAASGSASTASTKASEAATSASNASGSATAAATSAGQAASSATAASGSATAASGSASAAQEMSYTAEAWAVGTKNGIDVGSSDPQYHNNSKYYMEQAEAVAESIPEDYSDLSDDVDQLKNALSDAETAINAMEIVDNASGAIASFADGSNGVPVKGLKIQMEPIQAGSGDPSPDNVRPISGRSSITVTRTGKNLFVEELTDYYLSTTTGLPEQQSGYSVSAYIKVEAGKPVFILSSGTVRRWFYDLHKNPKTFLNNSSDQVFTPTEDGYIRVSVSKTNSVYPKYQIEYGSTATAYEPYTAQTVTIQLGQTVYGGTLDVTNGVLTVDRATFTLSNIDQLSSVTTTEFGNTATINEFTAKLSSNEVMVQSDRCKAISYNERKEDSSVVRTYIDARGKCALRLPSSSTITTKQDFFNFFDGTQVVYYLATPITYQCTPHEVRSLLGVNNIWSDADSVSVDYVADTKLYIEQLTEPDADMIADMNITSGRYFMVGNSLYLATANIANGAAIVVGVNCIRTSLAEALNAINA